MRKLFVFYIYMTVFFLAGHSSSISQEPVPVIFVHKGYVSYLEHSLWQAKQYNQRVILISDDERNKHGLDVEYYDLAPYFDEANYFSMLYKNSKYISPERPEIYATYFQRWFILKAFMEKHELIRCFHCESDCMLYADVTEEIKKFEPFDLAIPFSPNRNFALLCPGNCFITKPILCDFCNFLLQFFIGNEELLHGIKETVETEIAMRHDKIGDVFLLSLYKECKAGNPFTFKDICEVIDDSTFDYNVLHSFETYALTKFEYGEIKDIIWVNNKPYCYNIKLKRMIRFNSLHFYLGTKNLISHYKKPKV